MSLNDGSEAGDIIEQGDGSPGSRRPGFETPRWLSFLGPGSGGGRPGWRPSRAAAVLAAVTLLAGLGVGYAAGKGANGGAPRSPSTRTSSPRPASSPRAPANPLADVGPPIEQVPESCSAQTGKELQVGIDVLNDSATAVTLVGVKTTFPADSAGLTLGVVSWTWEPCGTISYGLDQSTVDLAPGQSAWLSVTLKVNVPCPAAYPVQFDVSYIRDGAAATTSLPGFPDLGNVPYTGCPSHSLSSSAYSSVVVINPATGAVDDG